MNPPGRPLHDGDLRPLLLEELRQRPRPDAHDDERGQEGAPVGQERRGDISAFPSFLPFEGLDGGPGAELCPFQLVEPGVEGRGVAGENPGQEAVLRERNDGLEAPVYEAGCELEA